MDKKICVVTGANSGVGKAVALELARLGMHVVMVCRNAAKGLAALEDIRTQTGSNTIDLLIADLSSQAAIHELAVNMHQRYSAIDILINNAGVMFTKKKLSVDGIEVTLATNYLAPFLLTQLLLDLLLKGAPSRIINVSSILYKKGKNDLSDLQFEKRPYKFLEAYAQSKLLLNAMSFEFARRLEGKGVTVNCIHPGVVSTNLGANNPYNLILRIVSYIGKVFFNSPKDAAKGLIYLATSPDMATVTGKYFEKCKEVHATELSRDPQFAKSVWEVSERLVKKHGK